MFGKMGVCGRVKGLEGEVFGGCSVLGVRCLEGVIFEM